MSDYRDVTPGKASANDHLQAMLRAIIHYLRNPIEGIKSLPDWSWQSLVICMVALSMISGLISGFIPPSFFRIIGGLVLSPLVGLASGMVGSLLIYYYFQVFEKRTCSLRRIFTLILFANIPFFVFQTISELIPPITLLGFAFSAMLIAVGLTENFQMEKRRAIRLAGVLFGVIFLLWIWNRIDISRMS
jgi:hypothetical protein